MRLNRILLALAGCMLMAVPAFSQGNPTGTISGRVVSADGLSLPGVAVTVASPSLQGTRTAATSQNGDYIFPFLPPGEYTVTLELEGFSTIKHTLRVAAGQSEPLNVIMKISAVHETVTVTGRIDNFAQTAEVATSYKSSLIEVLPTNRTLTDTMLLAPGIKNSGPGGRITIAGSMSFENLFLVNGVVVNENMFGQALQLYIEDALEETTTKTGAISAEYGRFSGGVVSALTKSGSNSFSGSLRVSFANDSWRATTPFGEPKIDKTIPTYEFTVGGPVFKDRLWFF